MPISIPTNIAGISVPTDAANGPLAALYGNKYNITELKYPRDLGSNPARNHVIRFTAWKKRPLDTTLISQKANAVVEAFNEGTNTIKGARDNIENFNERFKQVGIKTIETAKNVGNSVVELGKTVVMGNVIKDRVAAINLYVPDTLNVNYSTTYDDISITESLGKAYFIAQAGASIGDLASSALGGESIQNLGNKVLNDPLLRYFGLNYLGNKFGMQNLGQLGLQGTGQAINPQLQVLFRGIGFRTFQFDFLLTPYNQKEAQDIKKIIHKFKYHSAPEIAKTGSSTIRPEGADPEGAAFTSSLNSALGSPFFNIPETFRIEFFYKGAPNLNVNRIAECVLTSVNVDYAPAPSGWATHNEGEPVQTRLSLQFQEIEIIDKTKISEGY